MVDVDILFYSAGLEQGLGCGRFLGGSSPTPPVHHMFPPLLYTLPFPPAHPPWLGPRFLFLVRCWCAPGASVGALGYVSTVKYKYR
jgi:hypothetical protein